MDQVHVFWHVGKYEPNDRSCFESREKAIAFINAMRGQHGEDFFVEMVIEGKVLALEDVQVVTQYRFKQ